LLIGNASVPADSGPRHPLCRVTFPQITRGW